MTDATDALVLEQFARNGSEEAFAELVRRHIGLVHSVALRCTNNPDHAQEITQVVFIILARKAKSLRPKTVLSGWLYHTARLTAANFRRAEFRRVRREQEALMQSTSSAEDIESAWRELCPLLEDAMARLGNTDRDAIVLRFFENKNLREVGSALGLEERAAQKRVARGLEKLRALFTKRGVVLSGGLIAGALSAKSVQAAPIGLATTVTAGGFKGIAATAATSTLVRGTLKLMASAKTKIGIALGIAAILAATSTTLIAIRFVRPQRAFVRPAAGLFPTMQHLTGVIQSDGSIRLQATIEETNNTGRTIRNDDIAAGTEVEQVKDESGQPMKFTRQRDDGYVYSLVFNKAVQPGETVSYTAQGASADAIKSTAPGEYQFGYTYTLKKDRPKIHMIQEWRLPPSAALLEQHPSDFEAFTNDNAIELRLDRTILPGGELAVDFRYRLDTNAADPAR